MSSITVKNGILYVKIPYHKGLIEALKMSVPGNDRKWDGVSKCWLVDPAYAKTVQRLIEMHLGETVTLPMLAAAEQTPTMRLLDVRYLGRAKDRGDGIETAFAWVNGGWNAIFPATVLRQWFGQTQRPGESGTLYGALGVLNTATAAEIKAAWKRLARQWHPDVCREPDAAAQFRKIKEAFDILSDEGKRARYDAGLALEATLRAQVGIYADNELVSLPTVLEWAPPLRCGWVLAMGVEKLGRFVVSEILEWQDIVRNDGCVLVSSWPVGAEHFSEEWVAP